MNSNKNKLLFETLITLACILPVFLVLYKRVDGDPCIYFTFIKNFFDLPFSYQKNTVSFGATSPLQVVMYAPIYLLFGSYWILAAKLINFLLIGISIIILNRAISGNYQTLSWFLFLSILNVSTLSAASVLFETGLTYLFLSSIYYFLVNNKDKALLILSGSLYLIRPEMILVGFALQAHIVLKRKFDLSVFYLYGRVEVP